LVTKNDLEFMGKRFDNILYLNKLGFTSRKLRI